MTNLTPYSGWMLLDLSGHNTDFFSFGSLEWQVLRGNLPPPFAVCDQADLPRPRGFLEDVPPVHSRPHVALVWRTAGKKTLPDTGATRLALPWPPPPLPCYPAKPSRAEYVSGAGLAYHSTHLGGNADAGLEGSKERHLSKCRVGLGLTVTCRGAVMYSMLF